MQNEIKFADLFGGIGAFRLGIKKAGINARCVFYSDIDKHAVRTYNRNFGENHKPTDIRKVEARDIPDIDLLCAGFPCQPFSLSGKRKGFKDSRGTLFFEIARIVEAKKPKIVLLENVKGLLSHEKGQTFTFIIQALGKLGYDIQWMVLNSRFFGVPQNRERVFILASLREESRPQILPFREGDRRIVKKQVQRKKAIIYARNFYNFKDRKPTGNLRRLTPLECERLQGFPDGWTGGVSNHQRYRQLGNTVTVNVIMEIARRTFIR